MTTHAEPIVLGYRMDVKGRIFAHSTDHKEREVICPKDKQAVLVQYPEIALSLSNKG